MEYEYKSVYENGTYNLPDMTKVGLEYENSTVVKNTMGASVKPFDNSGYPAL